MPKYRPQDLGNDVAQVQHEQPDLFGSGRLIARNLVLTARHVVTPKGAAEPIRLYWKARLHRTRPTGGGEWGWCDAQVVWDGKEGLDLALLRLGDPGTARAGRPDKPAGEKIDLRPQLALRVAKIERGDHKVTGWGFPLGARVDGSRQLLSATGILKDELNTKTLTWGIDQFDTPQDPDKDWPGFSGSAVLLAESPNDRVIWIYGVAQQVPSRFERRLEVARLALAWEDPDFREALANAGVEVEPPSDPTDRARMGLRVLVPSVQAPAEYVDRPELTRPLLTHLLGDEALTGRAMISAVHGLGGIGKTTIARWLVWQPEIERRFSDGRIWVTLGNKPREPVAIISECVSQLDPATTLKATATLDAARAELATALQDKSILFVIDDVWPGDSEEVAKALLVPSSRSRFLLTTRFSRLAGDPEIRAIDFPLDEMSIDQAKELVIRALGRELSSLEKHLAERLCEAVGGHPFALELAAARIREGRSWKALLSDLDAEIAHLEALEEAPDDLIEPTPGDKAREKQKSVRASLLLSVRYLSENGRRLFAQLGIVSADASIGPKMAATLWETDEATALRYLSSLTGAGILKAEDSVYRMHDLMYDLARELLTAPAIPVREGDISGLGLTSQDASQQLLERYRAKTSNGLWHTLPEDGYIHDHLVQHFEQANRQSELQGLLWEESAAGHCGWYGARERLGQTSGFIADVSRVRSYADRIVAATTIDGDRAQAIALQLHCALIITSINSLSASIPIKVLLGSVRCGLITFPTALSLARQHPDLNSKVSALLALAGELPPEAQSNVLGEALSVARGINHAGERAEALAAVAPRLPAEEALAVARGIDYARVRAQALAAIAPLLPPEVQPTVHAEALGAARGIFPPAYRDEALAAVAPRLPPEEALAVARDMNYGTLRAEALAAVAGRLPPEEALVVARGIDIDDTGERAEALAAVALRLPPEAQPRVLAEALSAARGIGIDDARERVRALAAVTLRLPPEAQPSVVDEALSTARGIDYAGDRAQALVAVAPLLLREAQADVLGEALSAARGVDDAEDRAKALAVIAPLLPPEAQADVLGEALSVGRAIDDAGPRGKALAAVAPFLPVEEALAIARGIDDAGSRAPVLAATAQRLPADQKPDVLSEALGVARGIGDAGSRAETLAAVASRLVPEEALVVARGIDVAKWRNEALAAVAPRLPPEEALLVARGFDNASWRAHALAAVAGRLPPEEALVVARSIDDLLSRARALAAVARLLPPEDQPSVLGEALTALRAIDYPSGRAEAALAVASCLPPELRPRVLGEALSAARGFDHPAWLAETLAAVAPLLPPDARSGMLEQVGELLSAAPGMDFTSRALALAAVAPPLPPEAREQLGQALGAVQEADDAAPWRVRVLAAVVPLLPPEEQASVLGEALSAARGIHAASWTIYAAQRIWALVAVAPLLPPQAQSDVLGEALSAARAIGYPIQPHALAEIARLLPPDAQPDVLGEALSSARAIDDGRERAAALANVVWLSMGQINNFPVHQWIETVRVAALHQRSDCLADFAATLPIICRVGGETAVRSLGRSIVAVGTWWP